MDWLLPVPARRCDPHDDASVSAEEALRRRRSREGSGARLRSNTGTHGSRHLFRQGVGLEQPARTSGKELQGHSDVAPSGTMKRHPQGVCCFEPPTRSEARRRLDGGAAHNGPCVEGDVSSEASMETQHGFDPAPFGEWA